MAKAHHRLAVRQGVIRAETARERRERSELEEDLRTIELTGKPLPFRARFGRPSAEAYLVATRGPLPYMLRLREIEQRTEAHEVQLREDWVALAREHGDDREAFHAAWLAHAGAVAVDEVNDLIERHNLWYPVESRLPMDPRTGDYALVNGQSYRLAPLDAAWILARFPAELSSVAAASP